MTRINSRQVIQMVDEQRLVIVDEPAEAEIILRVSGIDAIVAALRYFQNSARVPVEEQVEGVTIHSFANIEEAMKFMGVDESNEDDHN